MRCDATDALLDGTSYPVTTTELRSRHGDHVIRLANGEERMGDVLSRLGEETYESPADLRDAILTGVGREAIGRRYYSSVWKSFRRLPGILTRRPRGQRLRSTTT